MDNAPPSISDILQLRSWKHALFTTYALSLSYFESEVLRPLQRAGCSDVWLIADADGYRCSLWSAGQCVCGSNTISFPSPRLTALCELLQSEPNPPVLEQGCADEATSSRPREHRSEARPSQPASSLRSYLIFRQGLPSAAHLHAGRLDHSRRPPPSPRTRGLRGNASRVDIGQSRVFPLGAA